MHEYNTGKAMWAKMPETMIKKVAEAAALRMAFPDELGGLYAQEEMDQANPEVKNTVQSVKVMPVSNAIDSKHNLMKELTGLIRQKGISLDSVKAFTKENFQKETATSLGEEELERTIDFVDRFIHPDKDTSAWEVEALDPRIVK